MVAVRSGIPACTPARPWQPSRARRSVRRARPGEQRWRSTNRPRSTNSGTRARAASIFPAQWFDRLTLDEAYRIQLGVMARRIAAGERQIGWKVGLTAVPIQQQFGFHEPVFGCILESRPSGHVFRRDELIRPGFEPELCLRVGQALSGEVDVPTVRRAIDAVYPALEIIETRGDFVGTDRGRDGGQRAAEDRGAGRAGGAWRSGVGRGRGDGADQRRRPWRPGEVTRCSAIR